MCSLGCANRIVDPIKPVDRPDFLPLEEEYKGCLHKMNKLVQESQGEVDCFV